MRALSWSRENWPLAVPLRITGGSFDAADVLVVEITEGEISGRGESAGVFYLDDTVEGMIETLSAVDALVCAGLNREQLREALPPGGARNALDCALWDLESKQRGLRAWELAGVAVTPLPTVNTVGIGTPEEMAQSAQTIPGRHIKVKLDGTAPVERMEAICAARPDAVLVVDVNQGWSFAQLLDVAPHMARLGVKMIEQPLPRGRDSELEGYRAPVPLCADESCQALSELEDAASRYQIINIKLDKTGGLTEALALARAARTRGLELMVGNMLGTSLAMAPAFVVAQLCSYVDLDGATLLARDRENAMDFTGGIASPPQPALWG